LLFEELFRVNTENIATRLGWLVQAVNSGFGDASLNRIADALESFVDQPPELTIEGGEVKYTLKNDNADAVGCGISPITGRDAEGEAVSLTESYSSDNPEVVQVNFAEGSSESNPREFDLHFGHSGLAHLTYTAKDPKGEIVKVKDDTFVITTGDVVASEGGEVSFPGLTPDPE